MQLFLDRLKFAPVAAVNTGSRRDLMGRVGPFRPARGWFALPG